MQINLNDRLLGETFPNVYMSVDGTDCPVQEPSIFDRRMYSHKFKSAGLRYEVGIGVDFGNIVWVNGSYKCGEFNDLKIFRDKLHQVLPETEMVVGDK